VFLGTTGCDTNHGSVVEYKGKWYMFYHNQSLSNTGKGNLRSICVDVVNFNDDGSIKMIEQTRTSVSAVETRTKSNAKKASRYEAETASLGGGATKGENAAASGGGYVTNLNAADATITFRNINGGKKGGRATIHIGHAGAAYSRIKLLVNGVDYSFLNALSTGHATAFTGQTIFTVQLNAGKSNTIQLVGGHGDINIDYIAISPIE
jgi:hypothetical protein